MQLLYTSHMWPYAFLSISIHVLFSLDCFLIYSPAAFYSPNSAISRQFINTPQFNCLLYCPNPTLLRFAVCITVVLACFYCATPALRRLVCLSALSQAPHRHHTHTLPLRPPPTHWKCGAANLAKGLLLHILEC